MIQLDDSAVTKHLESPIEKMLYEALIAHCIKNRIDFALAIGYLPELVVKFKEGNVCIVIYPQAKYQLGDKAYRFDFEIVGIAKLGLFNLREQLFIECDGREFHEKTPEQSRRDKEKDRNVQKDGLNIFRYTGSEVVARASRVAEEIVSNIIAKLDEQLDQAAE